MAKNIRAVPVRREQIDVDKFATGLLLLVEQLQTKPQPEDGDLPQEDAA